jgi:hypothetical protein
MIIIGVLLGFGLSLVAVFIWAYVASLGWHAAETKK